MTILILAAGYGTRLKELAKDTPKSLLEINGKPLLNYILDKIKDLQGLKKVIVVTNNKFYTHFKKWSETIDSSFEIKVVNDQTNTPEDRLGSIGDIDYVIKEENVADDLLVIGGDNLFDYNLDEYIILGRKNPNSVTIGLYDIGNLEEATKFGVVAIDDANKVTSFEEKPQKPKSTLIAMCCYYLPKETIGLVATYLSETKVSDTAGDYIRI